MTNVKILDEENKQSQDLQLKDKVAFTDKDGNIRIGTVHAKKVYCGKKNCTKCPHGFYKYIQYRVGDKVRDKYVGKIY